MNDYLVMIFSFFKFGFGVLLLAGTTVLAQESEGGGDTGTKNPDLEEFHEKWSQKVLEGADRVDSFFGNERFEEDSQQTRVKVSLDYESIEGESDSLGGHVSAKISLPQLSNKWALVINGDEEGDFDEADENDIDKSLALRFNPFSDVLKSVSFDVGIRKPGDDYEVFGRARHRLTVPYENWVSRLDNKLYLHWDYGLEYDGKLDFDRGIAPLSLFRARTRLRWWEEDSECNGGFCPEQHFIIYQRMESPKHAFAYEFSTYFQTDPDDGSDDYVDKTRFRVRYRHRTSYDWLFVELRPTLTFDRKSDYSPNWSFLVRLEGIFGYQPKYETLDFGPEKYLDD